MAWSRVPAEEVRPDDWLGDDLLVRCTRQHGDRVEVEILDYTTRELSTRTYRADEKMRVAR